MNTTIPAYFGTTTPLQYKYRRQSRLRWWFLALASLCTATTAWSQQAQPNRLPPSLLDERRIPQKPQAANASATLAQTQDAAAIPPLGQFSFVNVTIPNSPYVEPVGINNAGVVAGWYYDATYNTHAFLWQNGTAQKLDYPGAVATYLNGINNHGLAIGSYTDSSYNTHAVTYSVSASAWTELPDIPGYSNYGNGLNDDGAATGTAVGASFGMLVWIWHPDSQSYSYFSAPAAAEASMNSLGINKHGRAVGYFTTVPQLNAMNYGFLKEHDEYKNIIVPGALYTIPVGINKSDTISGWILTTTYGRFGFVRNSAGLFTTVNYPGSIFTQADGINDLGAVCGYWLDPVSGETQGFVAYPL